MKLEILDPERIKTLSGERSFERGMQALPSANIESFVQNSQSASARINGHAVSLRSKGEHLEGACSCAESDGFEFCQHCVTLALHVGKSIQQLKSLSQGPDKSKVMAYLLSLDHQELAKQMLLLIEGNPEQFKRYVLKASLEQGEPDYPALKKELTRLTKVEQSLFSQRQFRHYFSRIERFLEEVSTAHFQQRPESMLRLVEYGIARLNALLDKMEDRSLQRQKSSELLSALYRQLFGQLQGRDETRCKRFEKIWLNDKHQILGLAVSPYFVHADAARQLFAQRLLQIWQKRNETESESWLKKKVARYLLEYGEEETELELAFSDKQGMREVLIESDAGYAQLARLWLQEGCLEEAVGVLERGLDNGSESTEVVQMLAKLYGSLDQGVDRLAQLFSRYSDILESLVFDCVLESGLRQALAENVLVTLQSRPDNRLGPLRVQALMELDRAEEALRHACAQELDIKTLESLVQRCREHHPQLCAELLQVNIRRLLDKAMVSADKKAAGLMVLLQGIETAQAFDRFVVQLQGHIRQRPKFVESYEQSTANRLP